MAERKHRLALIIQDVCQQQETDRNAILPHGQRGERHLLSRHLQPLLCGKCRALDKEMLTSSPALGQLSWSCRAGIPAQACGLRNAGSWASTVAQWLCAPLWWPRFAVQIPGADLHTTPSSHAVVASHLQNRGRLAQMLAQGQSSSSKKRKIGKRC